MFTRVRGDFLGSLSIFLLLMVFWLLISASLDWQHIITGVIFCSILTVFWSNLNISEKFKTEFTIKQFFLFIKYMILLTIEIISANIHVAVIVLNPKLPISPGIVIMRCDLERSLLRILYANSITLCPGTITVELEGNLLIVHAFTKEYGREQENSPQYKRLLELESEYKQ
ncbi:MAG: Na+/H+ antiporter subunit E [Bacillota bacterium]